MCSSSFFVKSCNLLLSISIKGGVLAKSNYSYEKRQKELAKKKKKEDKKQRKLEKQKQRIEDSPDNDM
jgi:hypothetical protein